MASKDDLTVAIGRTVRSSVGRSDLNLAETAELIGVSERSMSRRVNGDTPFTWPELYRLAEVLKIDLAELLEDAEREVAKIEAACNPAEACDMAVTEGAA